MSRPRRTLRGLPAQLTAAQAARLLRLPPAVIAEAIATGQLATIAAGDGTSLLDTRALLVDLGVPVEVIDRLARRWPVSGPRR
jgi:hypothetical protein